MTHSYKSYEIVYKFNYRNDQQYMNKLICIVVLTVLTNSAIFADI